MNRGKELSGVKTGPKEGDFWVISINISIHSLSLSFGQGMPEFILKFYSVIAYHWIFMMGVL